MAVKEITAEAFSKLDFGAITIVDTREPDEVLVSGIAEAINVPFSKFPYGLDDIPKEKPVYVICATGNFSGEVAEILDDRGYGEVYNVSDGYQAYRKLGNSGAAAGATEENTQKKTTDTAEVIKIDAKGLKCPGPIVHVADALRDASDGTIVEAEATEDAFESDIAVWCDRTGNKLLELKVDSGVIYARIEKRTVKAESVKGGSSDIPHGKNFVVFSGDLDKTIAAFIMANGSAAMGRDVTMFFTFWGLNILRKPKKQNVAKTFIEKMFGAMMPRGTKKLGLSRMNMGGMGARMIRGIMKQKGIDSLEDLIQNAIDHGVRIIACQMSMDIMGIHKEELIDGVELGGVSTFLGSAEVSDMSLFI